MVFSEARKSYFSEVGTSFLGELFFDIPPFFHIMPTKFRIFVEVVHTSGYISYLALLWK